MSIAGGRARARARQSGALASAVVLGECWRDDAPHGPASSGWWLMVNGKEKPLLD